MAQQTQSQGQGRPVRGKLVVLEGLDGSGKTTQEGLLLQRLESEGVPVRRISFPDYDSPSSTLVKMYLKGDFGSRPEDVNAYAASLFYSVDRYASYKQHWEEDYLAGKRILAARYATSNLIHQMVKLPRQEWDGYIEWLYNLEFDRMGLPRPDGVILLKMELAVSQRLLSGRYQGNEGKKDIHERDLDYLGRCAQAADYAARRLGWTVISCSSGEEPYPPEQIAWQVYQAYCRLTDLVGN